MTTTPETHLTPETDSTSDHQTTPDRETSPRAEDPQHNTNVKITEPITPWHLRSFGILVGAGAPPAKINLGLVGPERTAGGAPC